jgi:hypothetical protein
MPLPVILKEEIGDEHVAKMHQNQGKYALKAA